jgi:ubiquinone/menaquinone biosynthesis C-methylase UbiE
MDSSYDFESINVWKAMNPAAIPSTLKLSHEIDTYIYRNNKIIDLGCGCGETICELSQRDLKNIVGIDVNLSALRAARSFNIGNQCLSYKFVVADAAKLPFGDSCFDLAIMQALLTVIVVPENRILSLKEAFRVLKSGGHLYIADFAQTRRIAKYLDRYKSAISKTGYEGTFPVYGNATGRPEYFAHHFTADELRELCKAAGFDVLLVETKTSTFATYSGNMIDGLVLILKKS